VSEKKNIEWLKLDNLQFPEDVIVLPMGAEPPAEGIVATCYDDGQLAFLGFYLQGSCNHSWVLKLTQGLEQGKAVLAHHPNGSADSEDYSNGTWVRSDAWSDNSRPTKEDYQVWVTKWLDYIVRNARHLVEKNKQGVEIRKKIEESGKKSIFKVVK
jgi:hypothetical protein